MAAFKQLLSQAHRHYSILKSPQFLLSLRTRNRPFSSQSDSNSSPRNRINIQPVSYAIKEREPEKEESPPPVATVKPEKEEIPPPAATDYQPQGPATGRSSPPPEQRRGGPDPGVRASRTREEIRHVKDTPVISPVSYPARVATEHQPQGPATSQSSPPPEQRPGGSDPDVRASWTREEIRYVKDTPVISPVSYPARVAPLPEDRVATEEVKDGDELKRERRRIEADNMSMMRRVLRVEEEKVPFPTLIRTEDSKKGKVVYDLKDAIQLVKANAKCDFKGSKETFEAHVKLTPELRRTDLKLSGSVLLPHGCGKKFRVAVFAEGDAAEEAREAGAICVGGKELVDRIAKDRGKFQYDKCFATREMMTYVPKIAKFLKRGLMPNPDNGTVTNDISRAVREAISQTIMFQKDKTAIVHVPLGKVTYSEEALRENIGAFVNALLRAKPAGLKKSSKFAGYVSTFHICSTMGPSFPVTMQSVSLAVDRYNRLRLQA